MKPLSTLNLLLFCTSALISASILFDAAAAQPVDPLLIRTRRSSANLKSNISRLHQPQLGSDRKQWTSAILPVEEVSVDIRGVLENIERKVDELRHGIHYHTYANSNVGQAILNTQVLADCQWKRPPSDSCGVQGAVHLQDLGDVAFQSSEFAGTRGESRRLEGFSLEIAQPIPNLGIQYRAYLQGIGDIAWVDGGEFVGTRGESRRLEGFAIRLTGTAAADYDVYYTCHLQETGDTPILSNGQFCGTRGEARRLEGLRVWIHRK